jgi:hypothetical protein
MMYNLAVAQHTHYTASNIRYLKNRTKLCYSESTQVQDQMQSFNQNQVCNRLLGGHALISGK